jgi:sugar phosphate isomerase/epimerase
MKLGCTCASFGRAFAAGTMDQMKFLEACAGELRVAGAELQDIHFPRTSLAYLRDLKTCADSLGLQIIGIGVHNDFGRREANFRQAEVVKVKHWIEVAQALGAPLVRIFAGRPEGPAAERWADMIAALREAATFAAEARLTLGLENHNGASFAPTADGILRILEEVRAPALQHLLDTGNYADGWPSIAKTASLAVHVHAKFWHVAADGSEPDIDYPRVLGLLRAHGYRGWLSFEYEADEPEATGLPRALAYLRRALGEKE